MFSISSLQLSCHMEAICPKSELQPLSLGNAPKGRPLKVFRLDGQPALCNRLREMGFCEDAEQLCRRLGIGYSRVVTTTPVDEVLLRDLRRQGLLR